jgi:hypothetical protein
MWNDCYLKFFPRDKGYERDAIQADWDRFWYWWYAHGNDFARDHGSYGVGPLATLVNSDDSHLEKIHERDVKVYLLYRKYVPNVYP